MDMEIDGRNPKGHPKLTWKHVVKQDLELMGVEEEEGDVLDRDCWRFRLDCMNLGWSRPSWNCHRDVL